MRRQLAVLLPKAAVAALVLTAASCFGDEEAPTRPTDGAVYVTPTGLVTSTPPQIFVGAGDIASCSKNDDELTARLLDTIPGTVFLLGDNVYPNGSTSEFANCYDPTWGRHKARTKPSAGNHDYDTQNATPYYNYFGASAGDPSKGYYSYKLGAWHIIVLNSNISKSATSPQVQWLNAELAANQGRCILAYFHHPIYSSTGGSGSGGVYYSSTRPFLDALYAGGADLYLAGHRHFYERMGPMKPDGSSDPTNGIRTFIVGSGGIGGGGVTNVHPRSEIRNGDTRGVLKMYLYEDGYAWRFIPIQGKTFTDTGSVACKSAGAPPPAPVPTSLAFTVQPSNTAAGATITPAVQVEIRDQFGNRATSATNAVTVALGANPGGGTLSGTKTVNAVSGVATFSTLSINNAGTGYTLTASASGLTGATSSAFNVTASSTVSASQSTVAPASVSITAGTGVATITVTARNAAGNPVANVPVVLSATGSGNTLTQPSGPTNAQGVATGTLSSTVAGTKTVSATADGVALTQTSAVTVTAGPASGSQSSVAASPTSITVGSGVSTITVTVRDAYGNAVSDATVQLSATGAGNSLTQPGQTNASGVTTGTLSSSVEGEKVVSATANGTAIAQTPSVQVTSQPPPGITHTLLTAGNNTVNQKVYTTASIAPAPNTLITLAVLGHRSSGANPSPTITGGGMTAWEEVATVTLDPLSLPLKRVTIFRAMSASPGSGAITITYPSSVSNTQWIVSQWSGVETSGANGAGAIAQAAVTAADQVNGLGVTLGAFGNAANVAYGVFAVNSQTPAITPGAGFTEISEQASAESPYASLMAEWAVNRPTVNATWTNLRGAALGVEIRAKSGP